jgi:DNA end-binding protein Ku
MASTVWRGNIAFGLVSIPVRLIRAARRERIKFQHVHRSEPLSEVDSERDTPGTVVEEAEPASQVNFERVHNVATAGSVSAPDILKGFEVEPNRYVTFKREEIKTIKPATSTTIEIGSFLHLNEIDPLYFDASYYVVPQAAGEKPYSILFGSLSHSGFAALGRMAMHGREHAVILRTGPRGLILETLFYRNEVHLEDQHAVDPALATAPELKMAEAFIKALTAKFDPEELVDRYEKRLKALIDERAQSVPAAKTAKPAAVTPPVVDIMEALRKSLEQVRKPVAKESRPKRRRAS